MANTFENPMRELLDTVRDEWERKTLLDFLRTEIARAESDSKRPGWTTWALYVAAAVLVSYFFSALEPSIPTWSKIGILFVLLSVAADCLRYIFNILRDHRDDLESYQRFELISTYASESRLEATLMLARAIAVYVVYRSVHFGLHSLFCKCLVVFLFLNIFFSVSVLVLSLTRMPSPKSIKTKRWWLALILILLWIASGIAACVGILGKLSSFALTVQDWKIATTLTAFSLVVLFMSRIQYATVLLRDLRGIERRLVLGQLNIAEAREKTDRILYGMTLGDVMEPYVSDALHDLDTIETGCKEFTNKLGVYRDTIGDAPKGLTKKQRITADALMTAIEKKLAEIKMQANKAVTGSSKRLVHRIRVIKRMEPHLADEVSELMRDIESAKARIIKVLDQAEAQLKRFKKKPKKQPKKRGNQQKRNKS